MVQETHTNSQISTPERLVPRNTVFQSIHSDAASKKKDVISNEGKIMTTTIMTAVTTTRATMFQNTPQEKGRLAIQEEKKDQLVDEDNFIRK